MVSPTGSAVSAVSESPCAVEFLIVIVIDDSAEAVGAEVLSTCVANESYFHESDARHPVSGNFLCIDDG
jgi:hypothetical protein